MDHQQSEKDVKAASIEIGFFVGFGMMSEVCGVID
jgi:hypothetical protein